MACSSSNTTGDEQDMRWRVSFAADLITRTVSFSDGMLTLRRDALRLVLSNRRGVTVDARFLRSGEIVDIGEIVSFPCHFAKIRDRLPAASATPTKEARGEGRGNAVHGKGTGLRVRGPSPGETDPSPTHRPPMADASHVGADPAIHPHRQVGNTGIKPPPRPILDLEDSLSHFWAAEKNPRSRNSESFEWWKGKVGGDPRSFAEVAAAKVPPPMATEVGRGNRGGGGAGHANRGGGRQPGRGNGRGGDRSKFSWKRDEGSGHTNSTSSTIAPASEGASRWDEAAAPKHRDQDGGIWVQKAKE